MTEYLKDGSSSSEGFCFLSVIKSNLGFYRCISNLVLKTEQELIVENLNQNLKVEESPVFSSQRMGWVGRDHSWIICPTFLLKQSHLREHGTGLCLDSSGITLVRETTNSVSSLFKCSVIVQQRSSPSCSHGTSISFCHFLSCCLAPQKRAWLHPPATLPSDCDRH